MTSRPFDSLAASRLAAKAHCGQVDKGGKPYVLHPLRVADVFKDETLRTVAVLHDIIEDTYVTLADLRELGAGEEVVAAVDAITHRKGESREDYYRRVKANDLACQVKVADILDNLNPARMRQLDPVEQKRLGRKYVQALDVLL